MDAKKRKKLEAIGWKVGNTKDFLRLTPQENEYIELKLVLARNLAKVRRSKHLTQTQFAQKIKSSQSRVAKMEAGDSTVSVDLLIKSLFELDISKNQLAGFIKSKQEAF